MKRQHIRAILIVAASSVAQR